MNKNNQTLKIVVICFALIATGIIAALIYPLSDSTPQQSSQSKKKQAPEFTLKDLKAADVSLSSFKGKVVFLNFWATWCAPCKEEMPSMQRLYQKLKDKNFEILAVSLDRGPDKAIHDFLKKTPCTFPILRDSNEEISKKKYRITGVPESFIINQKGQIVKHVVGSFEWDSPKIIQFFEDLIKKS